MKKFLCLLVTLTKITVYAENEEHAKSVIETALMFDDFETEPIESVSDTHYHVVCFDQ